LIGMFKDRHENELQMILIRFTLGHTVACLLSNICQLMITHLIVIMSGIVDSATGFSLMAQ